MVHSFVHTFTTTNPEVLNPTDDTSYVSILLINPQSNSTGSVIRWGGPEMTAATMGSPIARDDEYLISIANRAVRPNEIFVIGNIGDVVYFNVFPPLT